MPKNYVKPNSVHRIARLNSAKGSEVRMVINEFEEKSMVDLRRYYKTEKMEKFAPTSKGLSVPVEDLYDLLAAVKKAIRVAKREELIGEEDE